LRLKNDPALYSKLKDGCRNLARDFDRKKLAKEIGGNTVNCCIKDRISL
jgi:hypothetical protein